ncbi:MAG: helix-turn-helix transcriptional regulator [Deltaproteobacteria bacterium]
MADGHMTERGNGAGAPGGAGAAPFAVRREILGDDALLTVGEVAFLVGCSKRQIYCMIHRKTFPGPTRKLGVLSRWRLGVVRNWLQADDQRRC